MTSRCALVLLLVALALTGCATPPQAPVPMTEGSLGAKSGRVGVGMTALPKVDTHLPGAGCLLCVIAASAANSTLSKYSQTLPYEDLPKLKDNIADLIRKRGVDVVVIREDIDLAALPDLRSETPNVPRKDFSTLQKKYGIDRLLLIDINMLGFIRTYSAYFPTSDPKATLKGAGYMVNLAEKKYDWYLPVDVTRSAERTWDEPPSFPGLTNAYFQALELGKDALLQPFSR